MTPPASIAIGLGVLLASRQRFAAGLQLAPPKPSEGQLALMQRGYNSNSSDTAPSVPPSMGARLLPGLTMFMHFGPCTFLSTGFHSSHGCQWDIQAPLGAPSGQPSSFTTHSPPSPCSYQHIHAPLQVSHILTQSGLPTVSTRLDLTRTSGCGLQSRWAPRRYVLLSVMSTGLPCGQPKSTITRWRLHRGGVERAML